MKHIFVVILLIFSAIQSNAQVETNYYLNSAKTRGIFKYSRKNIVVKTMPSFNLEKIRKEDAELEGMDAPYRFGKGFDVAYSFSDGKWEDVEGGRLWTISFKSEKALSLNYVFKDFYLPEGASLYIENQDETVLYGPVTSDAISKKYDTFLTDIIPGDQSTIYLFEPLEKKGESKLTIKRVVHGYRGIVFDENYGTVGNSSPCNHDVACLPIYEKESNAIALVLLPNGNEWCSGSLLMNTSLTFDPYFLTAFHCIDWPNEDGYLSDSEKSAAENWMFKFCFKKESCNGSNLVTDYTYNKADFCSAWYTTDFALMKLKDNISQNKNLTWLGWDRTGNMPSSTTSIHHPAGDVMKISTDYDAAISNSLNGGSNNFWQVNFDYGITQGGSSGAPLINQNNRVVGQLYGGPHPTDTCDWTIKNYGKLYLSWTGGGTNDTRLSNWLDPNGTNLNTIDSSKPISFSGPTIVTHSEYYTINNLPNSMDVAWSINNPAFTLTFSGAECTVTYNQGHQYDEAILTASILYNGTIVKTMEKHITHIGIIEGKDLICNSEVYNTVTLPDSLYVTWSINNNSFSLSPSGNSCTVSCSTNTLSQEARLSAIISGNAGVIATLTKDIFTHGTTLSISGIQETYSSANGYYPEQSISYNETNAGSGYTSSLISLNTDCDIFLESERFRGMEVSFDGDFMPTNVEHNGSIISFHTQPYSYNIIQPLGLGDNLGPFKPAFYPLTMQLRDEEGCSDFDLNFIVRTLPYLNDSELLVSTTSTTLYVHLLTAIPIPVGGGLSQLPTWYLSVINSQTGQVVAAKTVRDASTSVNISSFSSGIYIVRAVHDGNTYTAKFIK